MIFQSGNLAIRPIDLPIAGMIVDGHGHNFDHTTYCVRGGFLFEALDDDDNVVRSVEKWATDEHNWVLILAGVRHRITALADNSRGHCVYPHRDEQGQIVEQATGWMPAYE